MKHNTHLILLLLLGALPLLLLPLGCGPNTPADEASTPTEATMRSLPVQAHTPTNRVFERRLTIQGTLEAKHFANVAARIPGNLDAVWVREGDTVIAGETKLFQIDPIGLSNAVTVASQGLSVAAASLEVAKANVIKVESQEHKATLDFQRYQRLHKDGRVSDNEFEQATTQHQQIQAGLQVAKAQVTLAASQVDQARANLEIARKNLDDSLVVAPLSGVVSQRLAEPGEQMSPGTVILVIIDPSVIEVAAFLPSQYYGDIQVDASTFRLESNNRSLGNHTITYKSPSINPTLRTFEIKGLLSPPSTKAIETKEIRHSDIQTLRHSPSYAPGSLATLTIPFESRQGLGVPIPAILQRAGQSVVFVVRDGKAHQQTVTIGFQNDTCSEILSGISPDDQVIYEGQTLLRDGQPVIIQ